MKKKISKFASVILIGVVVVAIVWIGIVYFQFISQRIYEDSTSNLREICSQVNRSFSAFVERNWGLLDGWGDYIALVSDVDDNEIADFVDEERGYWGFSDFYFLSSDGNCITPDGVQRRIEIDENWESLFQEKKPIMAGETLPTGQKITVFVVSVPSGTYRGFTYDAVGISFTNDDMANSLRVDAFDGKAKCFVLHSDGNVLLSTKSGGGVFSNYLVYLKAASDLDAKELTQIEKDWKTGSDGQIQCKIGGVDYCILYQSVGYQDYILLSAVPQNVISAGFLSVKNITMVVLIVIFLLIGASVITLIIMRNRSQSQETRKELKSKDILFEALSNNIDYIFLMLNVDDQRADYLSPNIERLLGIPEKVAREDLRELEKCSVNGDVLIPRAELESIPLRGSIYKECEYQHQVTGERRWYRMVVYHTDVQDTEKYIIVMSDRTQERKMNENLKEALAAARSANEAKSNFLSNMSHDIRTPMNAIVGFSTLLEKDADQADKVREYTQKIKSSSQHLLSLINDVLDMSKIENGKTSLNVGCFSLPEVLTELNAIFMHQVKAKHQTFEIHIQGTPPEQLIGDKLRLNQILINLLSNAIKYTPDNGKIEFLVCELPQQSPQYAKLRFVVQDNGIGMSPEFIKHLFDPFSREVNSVTNKVQGTGLGMAITKNLVDLMGGVIQVESQVGKGTTFIVELSFKLSEQNNPETETWFHRKVKRILVADDDEDVCLSIRESLRDSGVDVSFVTDGAAAVETAVLAHNRGEGFDVILLDWKMPKLDGVETARRIRQQVGPDVPVLVLTSYDWSEIEEEARAAGIDAFLSKPFFVSTFLQAIRPLFITHTEREEPERTASENIMKDRLFLVAEDNELNAEILTAILDMEGAKCELAANGQEAVEMFQASEPGYYDMILMDIQMPVMNGYEATRIIRACEHPEACTIPIVAMTANTFAEDVRNALDAGMDGHLAKPVDIDAMREMVGHLLQKDADDSAPTVKKGKDQS